MLAKTLTMRIVACLVILFATGCTASAGPPMIGQKLSPSFLKSTFCKKYKCEITDSTETGDRLAIGITVPGNKYSGTLDPRDAVSSLEFKFSKNSTLIINASVFFGTDYAINRLRPEYAELANDFYMIMTGKKMMQEHEYANGGAITTCLSSLGKAQRAGKSITSRSFLNNILPTKDTFIASCLQLGSRDIKQVNRWMMIQIK
ncbi:hypothetical protein GCM10008955_17020 [Deinococcus malanensis]|uniref:Lipoprotein n=1 Tax=Deinococcus malanensis TaxID=1706855 RepID=A0ABQ2EWE8_9DEIO|nr:hypothetical protein [Deinococcus malanensis]GGK24036.1 hypothetical protein GCM10008955_17020 [Deinococcus malanensis]